MKPLRIALLTHSTNPRGGVMHTLSLGDALHDRGHDVTVIAADVNGQGFPRCTRCQTKTIALDAFPSTPLHQWVNHCVQGYVQHLGGAAPYDIYHAQDSISGNALATMNAQGDHCRFVRTVHHLDSFDDSRLTELQDRAIRTADALICVSHCWADRVQSKFGQSVTAIYNGVDTDRFSPIGPASAPGGITSRPLFLSVGGIEERKNSLNILKGFAEYRRRFGSGHLLFLGGATLLDHSSYQKAFDDALQRLPSVVQRAVTILGVAPDADMPGILRAADVLVFPSRREGFGMVVLEAMASGTPVVVSRIEPFTEYIPESAAVWCEVDDASSIADATRRAIDERASLRESGSQLVQHFKWSDAARQVEAIYENLIKWSAKGIRHA